MSARPAQRRAPGCRHDGDLRGRRRVVGPQGADSSTSPLVDLLGPAHDAVPIYGSGGFTSYSLDRIGDQLGGWVEAGIPRVKMKVARAPEQDPVRLDAAREAIGEQAALFVDANGALAVSRPSTGPSDSATMWGRRRGSRNPSAPTTSRASAWCATARPAGLDIAAGEYGFLFADFRELVDRGAVDCLQADVTRCGGITGLQQVAGLCDAPRNRPVRPLRSRPLGPRIRGRVHLRHLEYFHDHVRLESMLFDGTPRTGGGALRPDRSRPGQRSGVQVGRRRAVPGGVGGRVAAIRTTDDDPGARPVVPATPPG